MAMVMIQVVLDQNAADRSDLVVGERHSIKGNSATITEGNITNGRVAMDFKDRIHDHLWIGIPITYEQIGDWITKTDSTGYKLYQHSTADNKTFSCCLSNVDCHELTGGAHSGTIEVDPIVVHGQLSSIVEDQGMDCRTHDSYYTDVHSQGGTATGTCTHDGSDPKPDKLGSIVGDMIGVHVKVHEPEMILEVLIEVNVTLKVHKSL